MALITNSYSQLSKSTTCLFDLLIDQLCSFAPGKISIWVTAKGHRMDIIQVHTTLERLCNLLRVEARSHGADDGLLPIQLEALHYLGRCNRYSDTVQGVTEYLGQTKGTVSQSLKVLENRGLVRKRADTEDRQTKKAAAPGQGSIGSAIGGTIEPADHLFGVAPCSVGVARFEVGRRLAKRR